MATRQCPSCGGGCKVVRPDGKGLRDCPTCVGTGIVERK